MVRRKGFTLIEVILFLAVTALLFAGVAVGTQNSINGQRMTDVVQNFAEFWRGIYAEVANPQGVGDGRSELALYGKLVVFGENEGAEGVYMEGASGESLSNGINRDGVQKVYVYDVVAKAEGASTGEATELLKSLGANVVTFERNELGEIVKADLAGVVETYMPRWSAWIEMPDGAPWVGSLLVARHPRSGVINTLVNNEVIEVNEVVRKFNDGLSNADDAKKLLSETLDDFEAKEVDFCVNMDGGSMNNWRRDVRILSNARNASGVEIIDLDSDDNRCKT